MYAFNPGRKKNHLSVAHRVPRSLSMTFLNGGLLRVDSLPVMYDLWSLEGKDRNAACLINNAFGNEFQYLY